MERPTSDPLRKEIFDSYSTDKMLRQAARIRDDRHFADFAIIDCDAHQYEAGPWSFEKERRMLPF